MFFTALTADGQDAVVHAYSYVAGRVDPGHLGVQDVLVALQVVHHPNLGGEVRRRREGL